MPPDHSHVIARAIPGPDADLLRAAQSSPHCDSDNASSNMDGSFVSHNCDR
jgi:hypothetical protein